MPAPQIIIVTTDNRYSIRADMGATPAKITDGFGGWQLVTRPRKIALTQFQGRNPFAMQIHIMFDGFELGESQEHQLRTLTWMSITPQGEQEPRTVRLFGPALPYPSNGDWVINAVEYGDAVIWDKSGKYRLRQDVILTVLKHVKPDAITVTNTSPSLAAPKSQLVSLKPGDTLRTVAAANYNDVNQWRKIADANGLRDPRAAQKLKNIRLP